MKEHIESLGKDWTEVVNSIGHGLCALFRGILGIAVVVLLVLIHVLTWLRNHSEPQTIRKVILPADTATKVQDLDSASSLESPRPSLRA